MTPKQELFVRHYLISTNATQAAIAAGYSKATAYSVGNENLKKPDIKVAIEKAMNERYALLDVSVDRILREVACIAFANPKNMFDREGRPLSIQDMDDSTAAAVAEVSVYQVYSGYGDRRQAIGETTKIKPYAKTAALELLMRYQAMFKDKVEVSGRLDAPPQLVINLTKA